MDRPGEETMYIQVNVGRNFTTSRGEGRTHLDRTWADFKNDVKAVILQAVNATVNYQPSAVAHASQIEVHTGSGTWDGVTEESAHVSLFHDVELDMFALLVGGKSIDFAPGNVTTPTEMVTFLLSANLPSLAAAYGQDAIAFIVTDSHLADGK
jgi:hypothetical protein